MIKPALCLLLLAASCATTRGQKSGKVSGSAPAAGPSSCTVEGRIVRVLPALDADKGSVCSRYPCRALVYLIKPPACGSSVSVPLNGGDTVELQFAYSLAPTAKALPRLKVHYPGLKKGAVFTAVAEQRLQPGAVGAFVVYGYQVR